MSCGHPVECIVSSDEGTAYCRWCALEAENAALRVQVRTARESRKRLLRLIETIQVFLEIFGDNQAHNIVERCESMVCEFSALAAALSEQTLAQERARCARIADAVAADFCADPDLPSGCQAARTIADAIRSGEDAPSDLATQCAGLVSEWGREAKLNPDNEHQIGIVETLKDCAGELAALPGVAAALKGESEKS